MLGNVLIFLTCFFETIQNLFGGGLVTYQVSWMTPKEQENSWFEQYGVSPGGSCVLYNIALKWENY